MHVYQLLQLIHLSLHISTFPSSSTCYICCLVSICVCLCAKLQGVQHARGRQAKFSQLVSEQQASLERFPLCSRTMDGWNYCECGPNISQFSAAFIPSSFARRNWTNVPLYHSLYLFLLLLLSTNAYIPDSVDFFWFCLLLAMVTSFLFTFHRKRACFLRMPRNRIYLFFAISFSDSIFLIFYKVSYICLYEMRQVDNL